jgi:hypothetical protein
MRAIVPLERENADDDRGQAMVIEALRIVWAD